MLEIKIKFSEIKKFVKRDEINYNIHFTAKKYTKSYNIFLSKLEEAKQNNYFLNGGRLGMSSWRERKLKNI